MNFSDLCEQHEVRMEYRAGQPAPSAARQRRQTLQVLPKEGQDLRHGEEV